MGPVTLSLVAFAAIFGASLCGVAAGRRLPRHYVSAETGDTVRVCMAVVGTLCALVLGLLISTASASFTARSNAVAELSVDMVRLDRELIRYGDEARDARASLHQYAAAKIDELFPESLGHSARAEETLLLLERTQDRLLALQPADERRRSLQSQAIRLMGKVTDARWLLIQRAGDTVPLPVLGVLICWLAMLFASFGVFAPYNAASLAVLALCSLAVSGGILIILEMGSSGGEIIRLPTQALQAAVAEFKN